MENKQDIAEKLDHIQEKYELQGMSSPQREEVEHYLSQTLDTFEQEVREDERDRVINAGAKIMMKYGSKDNVKKAFLEFAKEINPDK